MESLRIEWNGSKGFIELNCKKYFPCTQESAKKVFRLAVRYCSDEVLTEFKTYLESARYEESIKKSHNANGYINARQNVHDLEELISTGKHPIGTRLTPDEMIGAKADLKEQKKQQNTFFDAAKHAKTMVDRYDRNMAVLTEITKKNERK